MSFSQRSEHRFAGHGALFLAAVFWSTSGLFIKLLDWHPMVIAGSRSFLAAIFLIVVRQILPPPKDAKNPPAPLWIGAVLMSLTMFSFVLANRLTTSANVIMLQYSAPVWAALLGWILIKEKPHWEHWGALVMVFAGLALFFRDGLDSGHFLGNALSVASGMAFGGHFVFMRMMKNGNPRDCLLLSHIITAVASVPFFFLFPPVLDASSVFYITFLGFIQSGAPSLFFAYGIKRVAAVQGILITTAEPILNPVWVLIVTGEKPSMTALAGGAIIITAVVASSVIGARYRTAPKVQT